MQPPAPVDQIPLKSLLEQILFSRQITRAEERRLLAVQSHQNLLSEEQQAMLQRVFYGLRHGLLKLVD